MSKIKKIALSFALAYGDFMEILTKLDRVFESSDVCVGCGSVLGLKMILQTVEDLKNVVLVTSPGEISSMGKAGLHVNFVNSRNPAATARGIAVARPDMNVIVYSGDVYTQNNLSPLLAVQENLLYVCYNNTCYAEHGKLQLQDFVKHVFGKAVYSATANVAYYEDFIAKLRKAFSKGGFKFIDLLCPCPALWNYDTSNTIEIGRMATEAHLWPLYEIDGSLAVTKIPPHTEPVARYFEMLKVAVPENELHALQDKLNRRWRHLNDGKLA